MLKLILVTLGICLILFQVSFAFTFPSGFFSIGNEYTDLHSELQNPDINLNRSRFTRSVATGDLGQSLGRCKGTEFACNDDSCIKLKLKCDGDDDCDDGSDELPLVCNPPTEPPAPTTESLCANHQFQCSDGSCIKAKFKCDGDVDCSDGSDESPATCSDRAEPTIPTTTTTTTPKPLCRDNQFQCADNSCIKLKLKCDGDEDCLDGSDEFPVTCNEAELPPAPRMFPSKSHSEPKNEQEMKEIQAGQYIHETEEAGIEAAPEFPLGARTNDDEEIITEAERLIQAGDTHIRDDEQYRNVILVAGNSGAGKSTLAKFLTTDDITELESLWVGDRFIIKDKEGLISTGKASVVSKSIFPKLMINSRTNDAFYDLPGFGDTRGPAVEIANADFIKRVADRSRRVKILFVVNYSSLKSGETRSDFRNLLESAADYIKNPRKFKPAMALVANKVDVDMPTNSIIPAVAQFLKNARDSLPEIMQDDPVKRDQIAEILNTLLIKDKKGTGYARLGYFKQPDRAGLLSQIPSAQSAKIMLNKIVSDNTGIQFVTKSSDDFGLSMSPSTRLFATSAVRNIHRNVAQLSEEFGGKIKEYFQNKGGSIYALLQDYTTDLEYLKNQTETLLEISKVQGLGQSSSTTLGTREEFQGVTSIYEQLSEAFGLNQVGNVETILESLARHLEHLAVLEPLVTIKRSASDIGSGTGVRTRSNAIQLWATSLQHAAEDIRSTIYNMMVDINDAVYGAITTITNEIEELYRLKLDILYDSISNDISTDEAINDVDENLQEDSKVLQDLVDRITSRLQASSPESEQLTLEGFTNETIKLLSTLKIGLQTKSIDLLKLPLEQDLSLGNLPNRPSPFTPILWLKPVDKLVGFLHQEQQNLNAVLQETSHLYRKQALEVETEGQVQGDVETQIKEGRENVEKAQSELLTIPQDIQNTVESERKFVEENSAKFYPE